MKHRADTVADGDSAGCAQSGRPLVTVLLPVYNGARYLAAAIESILAQTHKNIELLVIDDGSTDGSAALADTYATIDRRVSVIRNDHNLGLISTLNRGVSLARSDLVARLDADDVADTRRIEIQVARFLQDPDLVALGTGIRLMDEEGTALRRQPRVISGAALLRWRMLRGTCVYHPTLMLDIGRACVPIRYAAEFTHSEDYELLLRLSRHYVVDNLPAVLVSQRVHSGSVSSMFHDEQLSSAAEALRIHVKRAYSLDLGSRQVKWLIGPRALLSAGLRQGDSPIDTLLLLENRFLAAEPGLSRRDKEAIGRDVALFAWKLLALVLIEVRGMGRLSPRLGLFVDCIALLARRPVHSMAALLGWLFASRSAGGTSEQISAD